MKSNKLLTLTILWTVSFAFAAIHKVDGQATSKVKVEIFYETLNDAVRRFFVEQFRFVSDNLYDRFELRLYPYGNTEKSGTGNDVTYSCPYGELQCDANKIHACLMIAERTSRDKRVGKSADTPINQTSVTSFVNCFFKNRYAESDVFSLAERCLPPDAAADWEAIHGCVREPNSESHPNDEFEEITVPVIGEIKADGFGVRITPADDGGSGFALNEPAKSNLLRELCTALNENGDICADLPSTPAAKVKLAVYFEAANAGAANYFAKQLKPYYHVMEDFIDIDLVPYGNTQYNEANSSYLCAQGEAQCFSTQFQAMMVDKYLRNPTNGDPISGSNRAINFIDCLARSTIANTFSAHETCADIYLASDDYITFLEHIREKSDKLKSVFETMRIETDKIAASSPNGTLSRIPTVTLNGEINYNVLNDLVQESCAQYKGPIKAGICTKVPVTVLYEALNHKSRTLFLEQLKPIFGNLYNLIDLKLLPAGRTILAPGNGFVCPNGVDQCDAIKLHACAIDFFWNDGANYTDPIRQEVFDFIHCTFKNKKMLGVMNAAELCAEQHMEADDWFSIHGCLIDGTVNGILEEYIEETHSLISGVENRTIPIVLINGTQEIADLSTIKTAICSFYDDYHSPDYCESDAPTKVQVKIFYESMAELAKRFFTTQYDPWYEYIEEMAQIELYPAGNVIESGSTDGTCDSYAQNSTCMANKIQALVIDRYSAHDDDGDAVDGTLRTMRFLSCAFNHPDWRDNLYAVYEYCTEETLPADDWFDLLVTAKSPEGAKLYKQVLDITAQFKSDNGLQSLDPLPWLTLDGQNHSQRAADDLLQTICAQYSGEKPPECTPTQIEIYYSAIDARSRKFFLEQLIPVYRHLRERIHLELIPYGVVNASATIEQECAVKEQICYANKVQACAIDSFFTDNPDDGTAEPIQSDGKNQTLSFIYCMFKNIKNLDSISLARECSADNIVSADSVIACSGNQTGADLLSGARNRTIGLFGSMDHNPWIIINGFRSAAAQTDLRRAICDSLLGDQPDYCAGAAPPKVALQFHYSTLDSASQSYVINELYPHYRALEEIIELDPVPFGKTDIIVHAAGSGNYTLICPGGVAECRTIRVHACLVAEFWSDETTDNHGGEYDEKLLFIEFLHCYFGSAHYPADAERAAESCVEQTFGDVYSNVKACAQSDLSIQLLLKLQKTKIDTLLPHLAYVPWITVDGRHNYAVEHHIQRTVCDSYKGSEKPLDCYRITGIDPKPTIEIHYEPGDKRSSDFFATHFAADHLVAVSDINLIPFGRSTYDEQTKKCVNDETECTIYIQHACLIDVYRETNLIQTIDAIACTFNETNAADNNQNLLNECVDQVFEAAGVPDPWFPVHQCTADSDRANRLMLDAAALVSALTPKISHTPWTLINGEHNVEAEQDLLNEICGHYYGADKPDSCRPDALLPVAIYYETLSEPVNSLFLSQLSQYTEYLNEMGDFTFVPYGSTTSDGNGKYECAKGDAQCNGNRAHACILNRFYNRSSIINESDDVYERNRIRFAGFLECTAFREENGETDAVLNAEDCLNEIYGGDYWRDIHVCMAGPEGDDIYAEMARQTGALDPALVAAPVITINGVQNNEAATRNLFQYLCDQYELIRAPLCSTLPSYAVSVGVYFTGNAAAQTYFREQIRPFYTDLVPDYRRSASSLSALLKPDLTAWGDTKYDEANSENPFTCAGGETECYINRLFACIDHYHRDEPRSQYHIIEFALCFFDNEQALTEPSSAANECANRVWIPDPFPVLDICAKDNSPTGVEIFLRMKDKTENNYPHLDSFPAITINNKRDPDAEKNLLQSACLNYQGYDHPTECAEYVTDSPPTPSGSTPTAPVTESPATTPGSGSSSTTPGSGSTPTKPGSESTPTSPGSGPITSPTTPTSTEPTTTPSGGATPHLSTVLLLISLISITARFLF